MVYYRQIYTKAPQTLEVPADLQDRPVEVIILRLDDSVTEQQAVERDELGWPKDFFASTAGQWQGEPLVREQPTEYETRLELP
jgi:hypothetical protein